ncbi:MAG TPA: cytosine permease [Candidatus Dormibacteraeota bacterium]
MREGEYGDRVVAVEPGGIEYIPEAERHGTPLKLFWTWMSANMEFATVFVGFLPVAFFGMGFWDAALALVLGSALGSLTHAILSSWGPRYGVPQMVLSRGAFGYIGNLLPAGLNTFTATIGWFIVNSVAGAFALISLFGPLLHWVTLPFWLAFLVIVAVQVVVAFAGHNLVHEFEKYAFPYLAVVFGLSAILIFAQAHLGQGVDPKVQGPLGETGAFTLTFTAAFGYAVGWNPYATDYTRYLPASTSRLMTGLWAGLGVFVSCAVLEVMGAALVTIPETRGLGNPTDQLIKPLPGLLAGLVLLGVALGAVTANVINVYSGAISFLTLGVRLPLRIRRAVVALGAGVVGYIVGVILESRVGPGSGYENFLLLISYWIAPFLAVVLVDYWLRGGNYDEREFFDPHHLPWKGLVAMVVGLVVSFPFWNNAILTGPLAKANPAIGDVTFVVGFIVTAIVYRALSAIGAQGRSREPVAG